MKRLSCLFVLFFGLFGCDPDPETTTVQIPIHLAPQRELTGNWQLRVTVSSLDMVAITRTVPLRVDPQQGGIQQVSFENLLIGDTVQVRIKVLSDGEVVSERTEFVALLDKPSNTIRFEMDKLIEEAEVIEWERDGSKMVLIPAKHVSHLC